jgi:DICT domain-containing protein/signal transduction histidine kinase
MQNFDAQSSDSQGADSQSSDSLVYSLLQLFPDLRAQVYFKASLTAISHAIEDLVLAGTDKPLIIANFQQERFYRQEAGRYQRIADRSDQIYVLAAPETEFAAGSALYPTIGLQPSDDLAQEWHLIVIAERYSACLVAREHAAPVDAIALDSARQFRGFWTFDPVVSRKAAQYLLQKIRQYRPDLASPVNLAVERYRLAVPPYTLPASFPSELDVRLFSDRLVTYLQASQYKQVKAYRRIVSEARQADLVNQITAEMRQSLNPATVSAVTLQAVGKLFEDCRCLLYRLPSELFVNVRSVPVVEHESAGPSLPSVLGKDWPLAAHPHFQALIEQGEIVAIADVTQDSGIQAHRDLQQLLQQAQIESLLLVPICYQQQRLAVIELHQPQPGAWSTVERDLLGAIAAQFGLSLLQAEAHTHLQQINQQLAALKQSQNNLVAIVGHELRTPLSTIQVCLESLEAEPDMPLKFQQSMVKSALDDLNRLRTLIQNFLLLSRLESRLVTWQMESVDLVSTLSLVIEHFKTTSQRREQPTIVLDIPADIPAGLFSLTTDGDALFKLFSKLVDNACKFTPSTGTVTIKIIHKSLLSAAAQPEKVEPAQAEPKQPSMLEVQIIDTGCGIEADQLETIFEWFHQEESFMRRAVGGAGLGLPICKQLAEQLGGKIWATSAGKGQGSQLHVALPTGG